MNICVFLTTRYGSSRLPKKHLMTIGDSNITVTDILIERIKSAGLPVIMTTPMTLEDNRYMSKIANRNDIVYFAGDVDNIIERHRDCAAMNQVDWIILAEGDDVLFPYDLAIAVKDIILKGTSYDCIHVKNYALGMNLLAYTPGRLSKVNYNSPENWGAKVLAVGEVYEIEGNEFNEFRVTLDYIEDVIVIRTIIDALGKFATSKEISDFMMSHLEICQINLFRNKEYWERLERLTNGNLE